MMSITAVTNQPVSSSASAAATGSTASSGTSSLASEQTFLKLFVSQLQNQDPLNPNQQDPTQMVSELAQFSQLEQMVNIGQNVQSINNVVTANKSAQATPPSTTGQTASATGG